MAVIDVRITSVNGKFVPSQDPVTLSKGNGDTIKWHNDTPQEITINFADGTPFPGDRNPYRIGPGKQQDSGNIQASAGTNWAYLIIAASGAVMDPEVIIKD